MNGGSRNVVVLGASGMRVKQQTTNLANLQLSNMNLNLLNSSANSSATTSSQVRKVTKRRSTDTKQSSTLSSQSDKTSLTSPTDNSTEEGLIGPCGNRANVNRVCPGWTPSAEAGTTPARGQLIFDASFESG